MAHDVETMAYVGEEPWHGLGVNVPPGITPEEMLKAAGLDWQIAKQKIWTYRPDNHDAPLLVDNYFSLVRSPQHDVLGICGSGYVPFQNAEVLSFFQRYCRAGDLELQTAGSLGRGKYIWALAKVNGFSVGANDPIDGYLLFVQPHIWGKAMTVMYTAIRVVCMNTLQVALGSGENKVQIPHIRAFDADLIKSIEMAIGLADDCMKTVKDNVTYLASVRAERDVALRYIAELMQPELLEKETVSHMDLKKSQISVFEAIYNSPGSGILVGDYKVSETWYGVWNAVTYVADHRGKDKEIALQRAWFGNESTLKRKALELAMKYAKAA